MLSWGRSINIPAVPILSSPYPFFHSKNVNGNGQKEIGGERVNENREEEKKKRNGISFRTSAGRRTVYSPTSSGGGLAKISWC